MSHVAERMTVLVVDDDPEMGRTLARLLVDAGYRAIVADTYTDGRFALETSFPDVLIVDVRLGDYNGLQLITIAPRHVATVVVTGHDDVVIEREAAQLGAAYLVKPVLAGVLRAAIERQLQLVAGRDRDGSDVSVNG